MLFSLEVILGEFSGSHLVLVIVSGVTASVISLGVISGGFAVLYIKTLYWFEDLFDNLKSVPEYIRPVIGGLLLGAIGYFFPHVFGVGYESIELAITGQLVLSLTAMLIFIKLLATAITIGSGGSGGVFAPGLFMGSMLGGTFGMILYSWRRIFPQCPQRMLWWEWGRFLPVRHRRR